MAKEQFLRLFREAQTNAVLRDTLKSAPNPESFVALANQQGFAFTINEWREMTKFTVEEFEGELSAPSGPGM